MVDHVQLILNVEAAGHHSPQECNKTLDFTERRPVCVCVRERESEKNELMSVELHEGALFIIGSQAPPANGQIFISSLSRRLGHAVPPSPTPPPGVLFEAFKRGGRKFKVTACLYFCLRHWQPDCTFLMPLGSFFSFQCTGWDFGKLAHLNSLVSSYWIFLNCSAISKISLKGTVSINRFIIFQWLINKLANCLIKV